MNENEKKFLLEKYEKDASFTISIENFNPNKKVFSLAERIIRNEIKLFRGN